MHPTVRAFEAELKEKHTIQLPEFAAGDTISVYVKIKEGNKERVQQFQGTVIQRRHSSSYTETFTVRKVSGGIGVIRVFPFILRILKRSKYIVEVMYVVRGFSIFVAEWVSLRVLKKKCNYLSFL